MISTFLSGPVPYDNLLSTKDARNGWEIEMSAAIITPQLKVLNFYSGTNPTSYV